MVNLTLAHLRIPHLLGNHEVGLSTWVISHVRLNNIIFGPRKEETRAGGGGGRSGGGKSWKLAATLVKEKEKEGGGREERRREVIDNFAKHWK